MVADQVTVVSRKAGETQGWKWVSDGKGEFEIGETERAGRGTDIVLHIKKDAAEFLEKIRVSTIITKYSDHIALPIKLIEGGKEEKVNQAAALWTRAKSEITEEQYRDFYRHVAHAFDEPWGTLHFKAEGKIEYTGLVFIPTSKPLDLFHPDRKQSLKLYVKRVFITDHCEELLPHWLRFVKGLVDSEDLPLNISREMLQQNPVLTKIRQGVVKKVLEYLKKRAENDADAYAAFWSNFGAVLKEGLYEEPEHRRSAAEARALPLHQWRCAGQPRRLCRPHEGRPDRDLLPDRRYARSRRALAAARRLSRQGHRGAAVDRRRRRILGARDRRTMTARASSR